MANGRWCTELIEQPWSDLDDDEREIFASWLVDARAEDLYLLLRYVKRARRSSSVKMMKAVTGEPDSES